MESYGGLYRKALGLSWRVRHNAMIMIDGYRTIHGLFLGLGPWKMEWSVLAIVCVNPSLIC